MYISITLIAALIILVLWLVNDKNIGLFARLRLDVEDELSEFGFNVFSAETKNGKEAEYIDESLPDKSNSKKAVFAIVTALTILIFLAQLPG